MHNTILLTFISMLSAVSASAQFYTITKETEISGRSIVIWRETSEIKEDTNKAQDSIQSIDIENENEENQGKTVLNARKSDDYKSSLKLHASEEVIPGHNDIGVPYSTPPEKSTSLPELTIPNLLAEIEKNNIKYPKIVLAQAILETGWFKSSVCRNKHNLFGLTNPHTGQYYEFNHWTESVKAYYTKVQRRYKGGNYLLWLNKIGYAEDTGYIRAIIRILRQLN